MRHHYVASLADALVTLAESGQRIVLVGGDQVDLVADGVVPPDLPLHRLRRAAAVQAEDEGDLLARLVLGAQRLAEPAGIVCDQPGGGCKDVRRRAVVLLEPDRDGLGEVVLERQDVPDVGAPPAVDRLVVVADDRDRAVLLGKHLDELVLRVVGVLVLVDEDVPELAPERRQQRLVLRAQPAVVREMGVGRHLAPHLVFVPCVELHARPGGPGRLLCERLEYQAVAVLHGGDVVGQSRAEFPPRQIDVAVEAVVRLGHVRPPSLLRSLLRASTRAKKH